MPPPRVSVTGRSAAGRGPAVVARCGLAVLALTACQPTVAAPPPAASPTPVRATTPVATPSPTPTVDLRAPGAARRTLDRLLTAAGPGRLIMVELTTQTAAVSVLGTDNTEPVTWVYRDQRIQQAASDLQYVDQASFDLDDFELGDVGRLFRIAAVLSHDDTHQTLQIVDYSGGQVMMAVSTNPESRTVFFNPDGSLLPELDYHTPVGIAAGLADVLAERVVVRQVGVDSETGAWASYAGPQDTTIRRQRPAKVPVTTLTRDEPPPPEAFAVSDVDAQVIWQVMRRTVRAHDLDPQTAWSVTIELPPDAEEPQLHFQVGGVSLLTDPTGRELANP